MDHQGNLLRYKGQEISIETAADRKLVRELMDAEDEWHARAPSIVIVNGRPTIVTGLNSTASGAKFSHKGKVVHVAVQPQTKETPNATARKTASNTVDEIIKSGKRYRASGGIPEEGEKTIDYVERALFALGAIGGKKVTLPDIAVELLTNQDWHTSAKSATVAFLVLKNTVKQSKYADRVGIDDKGVTLLTTKPRYPRPDQADIARLFGDEGDEIGKKSEENEVAEM